MEWEGAARGACCPFDFVGKRGSGFYRFKRFKGGGAAHFVIRSAAEYK